MLINRNLSTVPSSRPYEALTGFYTIDPVHSMIGFSVRHAMISNVRGKFESFEGLLKLDGSRPSRSEAYVSVQTESLDTGIRERDMHLQGPDFFDSSTFPLMTFRSTGIVDAGGDQFRLGGNLKIKDVELPITIDLDFGGASRDTYGRHRVGFEGTATLQRSDWGLTWNTALEAGGVLVSDKVTLILDISAVQAHSLPK
ncbi:polyisoprenoid-binding protein [Streptomyces spinoverrucosus]|uniref:Polyisoprenoid-binding protein n=1 Tax=Streptomyces spinoverrucosus TaxID=284043 RepID=A0A4Y3VYA7_9ACTN|nr:YceI family protein [Streptomyces spinoverrucosus]GEC10669.1 polyisoprenoid-binding protein [Streptomyces spinoverrucosus]GHB99411.1 polyisoprenoid-binding protein [Streptomyces spinoverrucosus]